MLSLSRSRFGAAELAMLADDRQGSSAASSAPPRPCRRRSSPGRPDLRPGFSAVAHVKREDGRMDDNATAIEAYEYDTTHKPRRRRGSLFGNARENNAGGDCSKANRFAWRRRHSLFGGAVLQCDTATTLAKVAEHINRCYAV